jgi:uncharacterized RmlC-like cupin family protein
MRTIACVPVVKILPSSWEYLSSRVTFAGAMWPGIWMGRAGSGNVSSEGSFVIGLSALEGDRLRGMKFVKPSAQEREVPRCVLGSSEVSRETAGSSNIFLGRFRVPTGAASRPHYHTKAESALLMLSGQLEIRYGDAFEETLTVEPGDMLYVKPNETHLLRNPSETEPAEYVVARDSAMDDSVEVPWSAKSAVPTHRGPPRPCPRSSACPSADSVHSSSSTSRQPSCTRRAVTRPRQVKVSPRRSIPR